MEEVLTGWQPDPFGAHEKRFFSSGGLPTKLVSDGDVRSYDNPPGAAPSSPEPSYPPRTIEQPEGIRQPEPGYQAESSYQPGPASGATVQAIQVPARTTQENGTAENRRSPDQLAPQSARLALLCANCGQRHNALDGVCPQCGEEASSPRPPSPTLAVPAVQREETLPPPSTSERYPPPPVAPPPVAPPPVAPPPVAPPPVAPPPVMAPAPSPVPYGAPAPSPVPYGAPAPSPVPAVAPAVASPRSINPFAIASLVLGLVGVPIAGSILAIVFGVVARRQIRETPGGRGGNGMAIWGIVLGCLGLLGAIIGAVIWLSGPHGRSPDAGADVTTTTVSTAFVRSPEKAAFSSASRSLGTADNTFTRTLASGTAKFCLRDRPSRHALYDSVDDFRLPAPPSFVVPKRADPDREPGAENPGAHQVSVHDLLCYRSHLERVADPPA